MKLDDLKSIGAAIASLAKSNIKQENKDHNVETLFTFSEDAQDMMTKYQEGDIDTGDIKKDWLNENLDKKLTIADEVAGWDSDENKILELDEVKQDSIYSGLSDIFAGTTETFTIEELLNYQQLLDNDGVAGVSNEEKEAFGLLVKATNVKDKSTGATFKSGDFLVALQNAISKDPTKTLTEAQRAIIDSLNAGRLEVVPPTEQEKSKATITSMFQSFFAGAEINVAEGDYNENDKVTKFTTTENGKTVTWNVAYSSDGKTTITKAGLTEPNEETIEISDTAKNHKTVNQTVNDNVTTLKETTKSFIKDGENWVETAPHNVTKTTTKHPATENSLGFDVYTVEDDLSDTVHIPTLTIHATDGDIMLALPLKDADNKDVSIDFTNATIKSDGDKLVITSGENIYTIANEKVENQITVIQNTKDKSTTETTAKLDGLNLGDITVTEFNSDNTVKTFTTGTTPNVVTWTVNGNTITSSDGQTISIDGKTRTHTKGFEKTVTTVANDNDAWSSGSSVKTYTKTYTTDQLFALLNADNKANITATDLATAWKKAAAGSFERFIIEKFIDISSDGAQYSPTQLFYYVANGKNSSNTSDKAVQEIQSGELKHIFNVSGNSVEITPEIIDATAQKAQTTENQNTMNKAMYTNLFGSATVNGTQTSAASGLYYFTKLTKTMYDSLNDNQKTYLKNLGLQFDDAGNVKTSTIGRNTYVVFNSNLKDVINNNYEPLNSQQKEYQSIFGSTSKLTSTATLNLGEGSKKYYYNANLTVEKYESLSDDDKKFLIAVNGGKEPVMRGNYVYFDNDLSTFTTSKSVDVSNITYTKDENMTVNDLFTLLNNNIAVSSDSDTITIADIKATYDKADATKKELLKNFINVSSDGKYSATALFYYIAGVTTTGQTGESITYPELVSKLGTKTFTLENLSTLTATAKTNANATQAANQAMYKAIFGSSNLTYNNKLSRSNAGYYTTQVTSDTWKNYTDEQKAYLKGIGLIVDENCNPVLTDGKYLTFDSNLSTIKNINISNYNQTNANERMFQGAFGQITKITKDSKTNLYYDTNLSKQEYDLLPDATKAYLKSIGLQFNGENVKTITVGNVQYVAFDSDLQDVIANNYNPVENQTKLYQNIFGNLAAKFNATKNLNFGDGAQTYYSTTSLTTTKYEALSQEAKNFLKQLNGGKDPVIMGDKVYFNNDISSFLSTGSVEVTAVSDLNSTTGTVDTVNELFTLLNGSKATSATTTISVSNIINAYKTASAENKKLIEKFIDVSVASDGKTYTYSPTALFYYIANAKNSGSTKDGTVTEISFSELAYNLGTGNLTEAKLNEIAAKAQADNTKTNKNSAMVLASKDIYKSIFNQTTKITAVKSKDTTQGYYDSNLTLDRYNTLSDAQKAYLKSIGLQFDGTNVKTYVKSGKTYVVFKTDLSAIINNGYQA